jgi:sulfur-oxidizing protein SoxA
MRGVAARYPAHDASSDRVVNLEQRINTCRTRHQGTAAWAYESEALLSLSAYVAHQSRGMPVDGSVPPALKESFERGRQRYQQRIGQMNLACVHCHQQNWGRTLLAQTISQGHGNAYPAYRLEWQAAGSLQRRLRACFFGVRAEMPAYEAQELLDLEVYLAWRGRGLPIESPGVRR